MCHFTWFGPNEFSGMRLRGPPTYLQALLYYRFYVFGRLKKVSIDTSHGTFLVIFGQSIKNQMLAMTRRNSPNQIQSLDDLSQLSEIVSDKRRGQRSLAKKSRRNRHYEKQFIRNTVMHKLINES